MEIAPIVTNNWAGLPRFFVHFSCNVKVTVWILDVIQFIDGSFNECFVVFFNVVLLLYPYPFVR